MSPQDKQFFIQQRRLRCQGGKPKGVKAESVVRPLFRPELASVEPKTDRQRWLEYQAKLAQLEVA